MYRVHGHSNRERTSLSGADKRRTTAKFCQDQTNKHLARDILIVPHVLFSYEICNLKPIRRTFRGILFLDASKDYSSQLRTLRHAVIQCAGEEQSLQFS